MTEPAAPVTSTDLELYPYTLRAEMAAEGWESDDRCGSSGWGAGKVGYSIWFARWDWHGKITHRVTICAGTSDPAKIPATVRYAAELARRAWREFPDSVPFVDSRGQLVKDVMASRFWETARKVGERSPGDLQGREEQRRARLEAGLVVTLVCRGCGARTFDPNQRYSHDSVLTPIAHRLACPTVRPEGTQEVLWRPGKLGKVRVWVGSLPRAEAPGFSWEVATAPGVEGARLARGACRHGLRTVHAHALKAAMALAREALDPRAGASARVAFAEAVPRAREPSPKDSAQRDRDVLDVHVCRHCAAESNWPEFVDHRLECQGPKHLREILREEEEPLPPVTWSRVRVRGCQLHLGVRPHGIGHRWEVSTERGCDGERLVGGFSRGKAARARSEALAAASERLAERPGPLDRARFPE